MFISAVDRKSNARIIIAISIIIPPHTTQLVRHSFSRKELLLKQGEVLHMNKEKLTHAPIVVVVVVFLSIGLERSRFSASFPGAHSPSFVACLLWLRAALSFSEQLSQSSISLFSSPFCITIPTQPPHSATKSVVCVLPSTSSQHRFFRMRNEGSTLFGFGLRDDSNFTQRE